MNKLYMASILAAALLILGLVFYKNNENLSTKDGYLTIGTAAGYAPFVSINAAGEYEGFDIDVAQKIAQALGKQLVIKDLGSMSALFTALEQGSIDAIIWGLSITEERLKKVAMIRYQGETTTEYPLLFWETIPQGVTSIDDMDGLTISVEASSAQESALSGYPALNKHYVDKIDDALLNIQYGKTDAAIVEPAIAQKFKKKYPQIISVPLKLAPSDQVQGIGIAIKKNNLSAIDQIQQAVQKLEHEGVIKALEQKWGIV